MDEDDNISVANLVVVVTGEGSTKEVRVYTGGSDGSEALAIVDTMAGLFDAVKDSYMEGGTN